MKNTAPVVVLRSNDICFLGILRSLKAVHAPVLPVTFTWENASPWYSESSQLFKDPQVITNPFDNSDQAMRDLQEIGKTLFATYKQKSLIIPSSDTNLMFLLDYHAEFSPYFYFIGSVSFTENRKDITNKIQCFKTLQEKSLPTPKTLGCSSTEDILHCTTEITYPCIYKPAHKDYGQTFYKQHNGLKAIECKDASTLRTALKKEMQAGFSLVVQEKIEFTSVYEEIPFYLYADENSKITMAATAIKEQIQPFPFGTATILRLSYHDELLELAQEVASATQWRGMLMIEFIKDLKDNQWKIIELNGRPWLFIDFFRRAGFNFVGELYKDFCGSLEPSQQMLTPSKDVTEYAHIHLSDAYKNSPTASQSIRSFIGWFSSIEGRKSLTYLDPTDLEPGHNEINALADQLGFDRQEFQKQLQKILSSQFY